MNRIGRPMKEENYKRRFMTYVYPEPNTGCWLWSGSVNGSGYGFLHKSTNNPFVTAHRYSFFIHKGDFDRSLCVLHHCDTPCCVNPDHLYLGDPKQNAIDRDSRGRGVKIRGEDSVLSKLSNDTVIQIFKAAHSGLYFDREVADMFGTTRDNIKNIKHRKNWRHITEKLL